MIKNYITLAWRVLSRKKFFTFITLFGISFTLMVLMLLMSFLQTEFTSNAPLEHQDDLILFDHITLRKIHKDTVVEIDTNYVDGLMVLDSTTKIQDAGSDMSRNSFGIEILEEHFTKLESVDKYTIYNSNSLYDIFQNNQKISVNVNFCDANFWQVFNFDFIEGRPFSNSELDQELPVMVINTEFSKEYFGRTKDVLGEEIKLEGKLYKIVGLIRKPNVSFEALNAYAYAPYTTIVQNPNESYYFGGYNMAAVASQNRDKAMEEIGFVSSNIPMDKHDYYEELEIKPKSYLEKYAQSVLYYEDPSKSLKWMKYILLGLAGLFVTLPILNLINLNVSRIMDRSSEIGVRKAFGATKSEILTQFVFENVVQTLLGGIIGLLLSFIAIYLINDSKILGTVKLAVDLQFFLFSFILVFIFGVLSGLLPAYRMSNLQIVNALKSLKL